MYHEISDQQRQHRRRRGFLICAILAVVLALGAVGYHFARISMNEQAAAAMRQSILDTANQCCAVEGAYPLSLEHLEENYGLTINRDDFIITYQAYATNIMPNVVVIPR